MIPHQIRRFACDLGDWTAVSEYLGAVYASAPLYPEPRMDPPSGATLRNPGEEMPIMAPVWIIRSNWPLIKGKRQWVGWVHPPL